MAPIFWEVTTLVYARFAILYQPYMLGVIREWQLSAVLKESSRRIGELLGEAADDSPVY